MHAKKVVYTAIRHFGDFNSVMECSHGSFCIAPEGSVLIFSKEDLSATEIAKPILFSLAKFLVTATAKNENC